MASPGNQDCANCVGTLSFPITPVPHNVCDETSVSFIRLLELSRCMRSRVYVTVGCPSVRPSVPAHDLQQQIRRCSSAAVGPMGRYPSIAAWPALSSSGVRMRAVPTCQRTQVQLHLARPPLNLLATSLMTYKINPILCYQKLFTGRYELRKRTIVKRFTDIFKAQWQLCKQLSNFFRIVCQNY